MHVLEQQCSASQRAICAIAAMEPSARAGAAMQSVRPVGNCASVCVPGLAMVCSNHGLRPLSLLTLARCVLMHQNCHAAPVHPVITEI